MPGLPTPDECRQLFRETRLDPRVVDHVEAVADLGRKVALGLRERKHVINVELAVAGCLLHDIGRAKTHGLDHAMVGARMLREKGFPEPLCLCVERHTGGGIDATEAPRLGLPMKDYNPVTLEEKLVCHTDNLFDDASRQPVARELDWLRQQKLDHVAEKIQKLHSELSSLLGVDLDRFE